MNVFVTGGTGFVGAHLVQALRARGDSVAALVRRPALAEQLGWGPEVRLVRGDLDTGLLDRVDSILFAAPAAFYFFRLFLS